MTSGNEKKWKLIFTLAALPAVLFVSSIDRMKPRSVASIPQLRNWGLSNNVTNSHIHAPDAWKLELGSRNVVVAVVDTGIDPNHPDLKNNLWHDPKTGIYGWDFVRNAPNPKDDHGHGTHVSGILGATSNPKSGISGVSPRVSIMAVKYYSERNTGAENLRNSIAALNWAIDHGANVINYSGGGPEFSAAEYAAIRRAQDKGILLVAAAGNEKQDTDNQESLYYPCAYHLDNILCVAATNIKNGMLASSNWGHQRVDVAAPGENILSTAPNGKYSYMSGTSQATAFVSGLAALLLAKKHDLKPPQIKNIVRNSVDKLPSLRGKVYSEGKVNAASALLALNKLNGVPSKPALVDSTRDVIAVPRARIPSKSGEIVKVNAKGQKKKFTGAYRFLAY